MAIRFDILSFLNAICFEKEIAKNLESLLIHHREINIGRILIVWLLPFIYCYLLSFTLTGSQAPDFIYYLLLLSNHLSKYQSVSSQFNLEDLARNSSFYAPKALLYSDHFVRNCASFATKCSLRAILPRIIPHLLDLQDGLEYNFFPFSSVVSRREAMLCSRPRDVRCKKKKRRKKHKTW